MSDPIYVELLHYMSVSVSVLLSSINYFNRHQKNILKLLGSWENESRNIASITFSLLSVQISTELQLGK